jgi:hypothetical protein
MSVTTGLLMTPQEKVVRKPCAAIGRPLTGSTHLFSPAFIRPFRSIAAIPQHRVRSTPCR